MKICVVGVGAVGGYFGGKLARAGFDVTFISRGQTLEVLQKDGLRIKSYAGDFSIKKPKVAHDFKVLADADLILLCVKSYCTKEVAKAMQRVISDKTVIVSLQNGIENEDILADILGTDKVIGSVVFITSSMPEPGLINHTSYGKIMLGELNGKETERVRKIEKLFLDAAVPAGVTLSIKKELWKKLMLNIPYNGFTALVRGPLKNYFDVPEAQECFWRAMKEVQAVAQMEGHFLTDEDVENALKFTKADGFINFKSSTLLDIEAGKPVEIEAMQGAVMKAAKKYNIDVPINKLIYALLKMSYFE
jgi:2-dehydropantoate 2-reductase